MALTHEQYQNIMATAVANARKGNAVLRPKYNGKEVHGWEAVDLETYFNEVHESFYEKFNRAAPETEESKKAKCIVFAASHALEIAYGVVACEQIKHELDNIFADKNNPLLNGLSDKEKAETIKQMKDMVDKQVLETDRSEDEKRLVASVQSLLKNNYKGNPNRFLSESFACLNWMNDQILKKDLTTDKLEQERFRGDGVVKKVDETDMANLKESVLAYADGISDTLDDILIHPFLSKNFAITYDKHDAENSINPQVFLQHYEEGKLTEEEKNWAVRRTNDMMDEARNLFITSGLVDNPRVSIDKFSVGGNQLVSDEDARNPAKAADMSAKVMASVLKGDDVVVNSRGGLDVPMHINPHLCDKTVNSFWESIWEKLSEIISKIWGNTTERKSLSEMIDKLDKTNEEREKARRPLNFDELQRAGNAFDKVETTTEKAAPTRQATIQNDGMHR